MWLWYLNNPLWCEITWPMFYCYWEATKRLLLWFNQLFVQLQPQGLFTEWIIFDYERQSEAMLSDNLFWIKDKEIQQAYVWIYLQLLVYMLVWLAIFLLGHSHSNPLVSENTLLVPEWILHDDSQMCWNLYTCPYLSFD